MKKKVAIIGTNGVPSNYGGFETLVEFLVHHLSDEYELTVICSNSNKNIKLKEYKGAKLKYISLSANNWQSIFFDIVSYFKSFGSNDKIIILGSSGCIALPFFFFYKKKLIFNFGGLDWKRSKWNFLTQKYLKLSESLGIRFSKYLIADNLGIKQYIKAEYNKESYLITYGGDQAVKVLPTPLDIKKYSFLSNEYVFSVARIQPDNNIEMILNSFTSYSPYLFVLVGNWSGSEYGIKLKKQFSGHSKLLLLDAIYDLRELNLLRSNCKIYLHGHSAGGTNPALVEAMNLGLPIFAFNNNFNRHTTNEGAFYFDDSLEISNLINKFTNEELNSIGIRMGKFAKENYQWKLIAEKYASIIELN